MRLLLGEADRLQQGLLTKALRKDGYAVDLVVSCQEAKALFDINVYNLVVIDWSLPGGGGVRLCEDIRHGGSPVPILIMSTRADDHDEVDGLDAGADAYLQKPFGIRQFYANLQALLRRQPTVLEPMIVVGDLAVDTRTQQVLRSGNRLTLTPKEYAVLEFLVRNVGRVLTRAEITNQCWDDNHDPASHTLEVHVNRLRAKLNTHGRMDLIRTCRGQGYCFGVPQDSDGVP